MKQKWPQSNQRGIEISTINFLNRLCTSPQSNQRGIEIGLMGGSVVLGILASIEPAWD